MTPLLPKGCDCCSEITRRTFLKTTVSGLAVAATGALPALAAERLQAIVTRKPQPETLVATLYKSLTEEQQKAVVFPFDHPLRSKVDNNWHITDKTVAQFYTADQQAMIREIFLGIHSPEYAEKVMQQVEHDAGKEGFGGSSIALFGEPGKGKFEFVLTGRHATRRCDGDSVEGAAFGDSITAGGDASEPGLIFWERWASALRQKYPRSTVEAINGATGGDSTVQGLQRLSEKVLEQKPDLVLIGFGMNDHNRGGVPPNVFAENLRTMIDRIRVDTGAEVVMFSAFPPNPKWHYGTHNMTAYALATEQVAREKHCAFADVFKFWMQFEVKKKPEDLLGNNINHPNDFGHWIYFQALQAVEL